LVATRHLALFVDVDEPVRARHFGKALGDNTPGTIGLPARGLKLSPVNPGVTGGNRPPRNREHFSFTQSFCLTRGSGSGFGVGTLVMATPDKTPQSCTQEEQ
jgi:hypothetical protein